MITNNQNKENLGLQCKVKRHSIIMNQQPFVGRIVKNNSRSVKRTEVCYSNKSSRVLQQLCETNFSRPISATKPKQSFVEKYSQIKKKYEMIEFYLDGKMSRLSSLVNSPKTTNRSKFRVQKLALPQASLFKKSTEIVGKSIPKADNDFSKIIKQLKDQINRQSKLRSLKHKINQNNIEKIQQILTKKYKIKKIKFQLSGEQFDPFMVQTFEKSVQQLAQDIYKSIQDCQKNWLRNLSNRFLQKDMQSLFKKLDFQRKREINLKSFVRQISMFLNLNLRRRDVYTIFMRLSEDNKITLNSFVKNLCG